VNFGYCTHVIAMRPAGESPSCMDVGIYGHSHLEAPDGTPSASESHPAGLIVDLTLFAAGFTLLSRAEISP
jgi:hypothetical protein